MPIKCTTPKEQINAYIQERIARMNKAIINTLCYAGEMCVNEARSYHGKAYQDQTGNLRSSIGYVVAVDGKIQQMGGFNVVLNGQEGAMTGRQYAQEVLRQYPHDTVLIVVAGRTYARYVAAKGYNVLQSAEALAEQIVPDLLKQLNDIANEELS